MGDWLYLNDPELLGVHITPKPSSRKREGAAFVLILKKLLLPTENSERKAPLTTLKLLLW